MRETSETAQDVARPQRPADVVGLIAGERAQGQIAVFRDAKREEPKDGDEPREQRDAENRKQHAPLVVIETPRRDNRHDRRRRQHDDSNRRRGKQEREGKPGENAQEEPRHAGIITSCH